jgi:hypothetical protein
MSSAWKSASLRFSTPKRQNSRLSLSGTNAVDASKYRPGSELRKGPLRLISGFSSQIGRALPAAPHQELGTRRTGT